MPLALIKTTRRRPVLLTGACVFLALMTAMPAYAQNTEDMDVRLGRLERDIETVSRAVFKGENPQGNVTIGDTGARAAQIQLETRIIQLETDFRELTGKVEEQGHALRQLQQTVTDLQAKLTSATPVAGALPAAESGMPMDQTEVTTPSADIPVSVSSNADPSQAPQNLGIMTNAITADPAAAYEAAMTLLKQKEYTAAEKAFDSFIKGNEKHTLAANARYWLGETYFAQKKYEAAARVFAEGYQQFPKGTKAADNLLKLGLSLAAMNNTADACVALQQIAKDFSSGASSVRIRADQEIKRLKCGGQ